MIDSVADIKPVGDKILVLRDKTGELTEGGVVLPEGIRDELDTGVVLAVGPGKVNGRGAPIPPQVHAGDRVQFIPFAGTDIEVGGVTYMLMPEAEIIGVLTA